MPLSERQRQALAAAASASGHPSGSVTVTFPMDKRRITDTLRRCPPLLGPWLLGRKP